MQAPTPPTLITPCGLALLWADLGFSDDSGDRVWAIRGIKPIHWDIWIDIYVNQFFKESLITGLFHLLWRGMCGSSHMQGAYWWTLGSRMTWTLYVGLPDLDYILIASIVILVNNLWYLPLTYFHNTHPFESRKQNLGPDSPLTASVLTTIMSKRLLENNDIPSLAKYIASKRCKKIVLMVCPPALEKN